MLNQYDHGEPFLATLGYKIVHSLCLNINWFATIDPGVIADPTCLFIERISPENFRRIWPKKNGYLNLFRRFWNSVIFIMINEKWSLKVDSTNHYYCNLYQCKTKHVNLICKSGQSGDWIPGEHFERWLTDKFPFLVIWWNQGQIFVWSYIKWCFYLVNKWFWSCHP